MNPPLDLHTARTRPLLPPGVQVATPLRGQPRVSDAEPPVEDPEGELGSRVKADPTVPLIKAKEAARPPPPEVTPLHGRDQNTSQVYQPVNMGQWIFNRVVDTQGSLRRFVPELALIKGLYSLQ